MGFLVLEALHTARGTLVCVGVTLRSTKDTVSEWLRRWTRIPLGSARRGSNPLAVASNQTPLQLKSSAARLPAAAPCVRAWIMHLLPVASKPCRGPVLFTSVCSAATFFSFTKTHEE